MRIAQVTALAAAILLVAASLVWAAGSWRGKGWWITTMNGQPFAGPFAENMSCMNVLNQLRPQMFQMLTLYCEHIDVTIIRH